jgi:outer membrane protein assembly factor BamB
MATATAQIGPQPSEQPPIPPLTRAAGNEIPALAPYRPKWSLALPPATRVALAAGAENFFIGTDTGPLLAYSLVDVGQIWTADLQPVLPLTAGEQLVFVATDDTLHALDQATGQERWKIASGPLAVAPTWRQGWLFTLGHEGDVTAWRASDGGQVWRQPLGSPASAPPAVDGDRLFVPLADGRLVCLMIDGSIAWSISLAGVGGRPFAAGERVFLGTSHPTFYSVDQSDGTLEWPPHRLLQSTVVGHPVLDSRSIWMATLNNKVIALSRRNGAIEWYNTLPARPAEQLIIEGGQIMVPLESGDIMAFGQKERQRLPSPTTPAAAAAAPGPPPAAPATPSPAPSANPPDLEPQPLTPGSRLAAPVILTGPVEAPYLLRATLGADDVHTVTAFQRQAPPPPPAGAPPAAPGGGPAR